MGTKQPNRIQPSALRMELQIPDQDDSNQNRSSPSPPTPGIVPFWPASPNLSPKLFRTSTSVNLPPRSPVGKVSRSMSLRGGFGSGEGQNGDAAPVDIEGLQGQVNARTESVKKLTEKLQVVSRELAGSRKELADVAKGKDEVSRQLAEREATLEALQEEATNQRREREKLTETVKKMESELAKAPRQREMVEKTLAESQKECREALSREADLGQRLKVLEKERADFASFRAKLQGRIGELEEELKKAAETQAKQAEELEIEKNTLHKWKSIIAAALKTKLEEAQQLTREQKSRREEAERQVAALEAANSALRTKVHGLEADVVAAKQSQLAGLDETNRIKANVNELDGGKPEEDKSKGAVAGGSSRRNSGEGVTNEMENERLRVLRDEEDNDKKEGGGEGGQVAGEVGRLREEIKVQRAENDKIEEVCAAAVRAAEEAAEGRVKDLERQLANIKNSLSGLEEVHVRKDEAAGPGGQRKDENMHYEPNGSAQGQSADKIADLERQLAESKAEVIRLQDKSAARVRDLIDELADAKRQLADLDAELVDVKRQLAEAEHQLADGSANVANHDAEQVDGSAELAEARRQLADREAADQFLSDKLAAVEGERAEAEDKVRILTKNISTLTSNLGQGEKEVRAGDSPEEKCFGESGGYLVKELERKKRELEEKDEELACVIGERDWLKSKLGALEEKKGGLAQVLFPLYFCTHREE